MSSARIRPEAVLVGWHLARAAWKQVLLCQPHDTLCGCSIDDVATAMDARLDEATAAATEHRDASIMSILAHDANAARTRPAAWRSVVLVRNASVRARSGVAEIDVDTHRIVRDAPLQTIAAKKHAEAAARQ